MQYFISFLEGIITFVSPCILPMLPIYISFFSNGGAGRKSTVRNALGFVFGFTVVFVMLGAFAGGIGGFFQRYQKVVDLVSGFIVLFFGLNFTGWLKPGFLNKTIKPLAQIEVKGVFSAFLFGIIFAVGWTPCVGAFLGSALMMAGQQGSMAKGIVMLILYSVGLGIPFMISAVLIDKLKETFQVIKAHYREINIVSGLFLILVGIMMMTGTFGYLLRILGK